MNNTEHINYPGPKQEYKVLVRCFTFNQCKYIEDALNGFAMQQTDFPFVCLVMDDASTDGEQDVIKKWMERECDMSRAETFDIPTSVVIIVPHKNNQSCTFAFYLLKQNLYRTGERKMKHVYPWSDKCEYEAICEGDDYWIDPLKLQKQVDFLEGNPEYVMSYTGFKTVDMQSNDIFSEVHYQNMKKSYSGNIFANLMRGNFVQTVTTCFRKEIIMNQYICKAPSSVDYLYFLISAGLGKVHYLEDVTSVYRINKNGLMCTANTEVNNWCTLVTIYVFTLFANKKIGQWIMQKNRIKINYFKDAIHYYRIGDKRRMLQGLRLNKIMYIYAIYALVEGLIEKIMNRFNFYKKQVW